MIVKNESHIILETLNSVKSYIDYWVICDTGSTDNTKELIQSFFDKGGLKGELHSAEWRDFGYNRTLVFELAFKKADYLWVIDADDILVGQLNLGKLSLDSYSLRYGGDFTYWRNQIFKGDLQWVYKGVLHEYPYCISKENSTHSSIEGNYYVDSRRLGTRNLMDPKNKYLEDAKVLEDALQHETDAGLAVRYMFYLAQSYKDAEEYEKAMEWYQKRAAAGGWEEEVYYSKYMIMCCQIRMGYKFENWLYSGLDAFAYRPARLEALYEIILYCRVTKQYKLGYQLGKDQEHTERSKDILFVATLVHDWKFLDELSICAYWVGDLAMSLRIITKILKKKNTRLAIMTDLCRIWGFVIKNRSAQIKLRQVYLMTVQINLFYRFQ